MVGKMTFKKKNGVHKRSYIEKEEIHMIQKYIQYKRASNVKHYTKQYQRSKEKQKYRRENAKITKKYTELKL